MSEYKDWHVIWEIDIVARTAKEAARLAQKIQRDQKSIATVFAVHEHGVDARPVRVDLKK